MDETAGPKPNVVLLVAGALRPDRIGCYGAVPAATPFIDALATEGVVADAMFCSALPASAAFAGMLSGQHPINLGFGPARDVPDLPFGTTLLPEVFLGAGYLTCTFDNLRRENHWLGRGSEFYVDPSLRYGRNATCREMNLLLKPWLQTNAGERFFLTVHYRGGEGAEAVDQAVGEVLAALASLRLKQKTLLVIHADCGAPEGLGERDLRTPLILSWPGRVSAGTRMPQLFQTEDLAPTLLEAAGLEVPSSFEGRSFWQLAAGTATDGGRNRVISVDCTTLERSSIRTPGQRLNLSGTSRELYDAASGRVEENDVALEQPAAASALEQELRGWITERLAERERNEALFAEI